MEILPEVKELLSEENQDFKPLTEEEIASIEPYIEQDGKKTISDDEVGKIKQFLESPELKKLKKEVDRAEYKLKHTQPKLLPGERLELAFKIALHEII